MFVYKIILKLVRLEEADFDTGVNDNIDTGGHQKATESHSKKAEKPIEAPHWTVDFGLLDLEPHETGVGQRHRQCDPSHQSSNASQERNGDGEEEAAEAECDPAYGSHPPRQWLLEPACVLRLQVVEHWHPIYLERAQRVDHHEQARQPHHKTRHVSRLESEESR